MDQREQLEAKLQELRIARLTTDDFRLTLQILEVEDQLARMN